MLFFSKQFIVPYTEKSALLCHYTRQTIGCPAGFVIKINSAFWGRRKKTTCVYISVQSCGVKDIPTITKNLQDKCDGYPSCLLRASETESYLNDPCPTVHKYLDINYTCAEGKCSPFSFTFKYITQYLPSIIQPTMRENFRKYPIIKLVFSAMHEHGNNQWWKR